MNPVGFRPGGCFRKGGVAKGRKCGEARRKEED